MHDLCLNVSFVSFSSIKNSCVKWSIFYIDALGQGKDKVNEEIPSLVIQCPSWKGFSPVFLMRHVLLASY